MTEELARILAQLSENLPPPEAFSAAPIPAVANHYIGLSHAEEPCLMIMTPGATGAPRRPLRLQGLSVQYVVPCRLMIQGSDPMDRTLTTIVCTSPDAMERRYFLYLTDLMLRVLGAEPQLPEVVSATEHLARMFQLLAQPARRPLTGLIGELLIIARSPMPVAATMAWRSGIDDTFDFAVGDLRLEVKAGQGRSRAHFLSYDQCHPPHGTVGVLASVFVESSGGGMSVLELLQEIEQRVAGSQEALTRLRENFAETLGSAIVTALEERFDRNLADESLLLFDLAEIPAVRGHLPAGVSQVRFNADLSRCVPQNAAELHLRSQYASQLLPI